MSIPVLRQPKTIQSININTVKEFVDKYVILTLKDGGKLVISSDSFNGIISTVDGFKCVFCRASILLDTQHKEDHKETESHKLILTKYPHKEEFGANLIRGLNKDVCYCTICNATMPAHMLMCHIASDNHIDELEKASLRAGTYQPNDANNNKSTNILTG